jgi:hypothetical protein
MAISDDQLRVRVRSILGEFINANEVVAPLCNDPHERHRYVFAVQREANGRGGTKAIFEMVHVGRMLVISKPRNNSPLATNDR